MKWERNRKSTNIEDRRNDSPQRFGSNQNNSIMMIIPIIKMLIGTKFGRIILILGVIAYFMGFNPLAFLDMNLTQENKVLNSKKDDKEAQFVSAILAQTEDIYCKWIKI